MVYRELLGLRLKLAAWVVIYGGWTILFLILNVWPHTMYYFGGYSWGDLPMYDTLFNKWLVSLAIITPILAVIGGADLVSEERNKGTLTFLFVQPITRTRIFVIKILMNVGALVGVMSLTSLVIFVIDRLPRSVLEVHYSLPVCVWNADCTILTNSHHMEFIPALMGLTLILLVGAGLVIGTGVLSIYCPNTVQTMVTAIPLVLLAYLLIANGGYRQQFPVTSGQIASAGGPLFTSNMIVANNQLLLTWIGVVVIANTIFFCLGLHVFKRKSF